jgi:hypothetical protein
MGLIQSAFWHRFVATAHSPIGLEPAAHGIRITGPSFGGFADNDLGHEDLHGRTPEWLGIGLRKALFQYMEGEGLTIDVREWFDPPGSRRLNLPAVPPDWLARVLMEQTGDHLTGDDPAAERRFVWLGGTPVLEPGRRGRGGRCRVILPSRTEDAVLWMPKDKAAWLVKLIRAAMPAPDKRGKGYPVLHAMPAEFPWGGRRGFDAMIRSAAWKQARAVGLLLV